MGLGWGGFVNSLTGAQHSAKQSAKYSSWLAAQQNEYQKEFAQNAHQWEVEDLKKAGLNPILSAGGEGATAGGAGGGASVGMQAGAGGLSDLINSASGMLKLSSEIENLDQDTELKQEITGKTGKETKKVQQETELINAKTREVTSNIMLNSAKALEARMNAAYQKRRASGTGVSIDTPFGGASLNL